MLKRFKPVTGGLRHQIKLKKDLLSKEKALKKKRFRITRTGGRNVNGHISIRHRGGGSRKLYRDINWTSDLKGVVLSIEYDPNRTAFIARIFDLTNKNFYYIIATRHMFPGTLVTFGDLAEIRIGNRLSLEKMPTGSVISLVSRYNKSKPLFARSAGTKCQLLQKGEVWSRIRIPSGKLVQVRSNATVTVGEISNNMNNLQVLGKAGISRLKGRRPKVRGVAMNPIDHPHGGGEGKTSGGRPSVTPWGKPTKGKPTKRLNKKGG